MATQELRIRELEHASSPVGQPTAEQVAVVAQRRWPGWGLRRMLALGDFLAVVIALSVALHVIGPERGVENWLALLTAPLWIPLLKVYGLYDRDDKRVSHSTLDDVPHLFHAVVMATLGLWLFYKVAVPDEKLILREGVACFVSAFVGLLVARAVVRGLTARLATPSAC